MACGASVGHGRGGGEASVSPLKLPAGAIGHPRHARRDGRDAVGFAVVHDERELPRRPSNTAQVHRLVTRRSR
jgi:hypothetical protein